jgi:methylamine dehydrogenase accessory protein MauD
MSSVFYASYAALWILFLVQALLLFLLYRHIGLTLLSTSEGVQRDGLKVGEIAPAFRGVGVGGESVQWAPQPGRAELLIFAAPDCEPCLDVFPYINHVATGINGSEVPVTAVVAGDRRQAILAAEKFGPVVRFVAEDGTAAFALYQVRVTPFAFAVGRDGRIQAKGLCNHPNALRRLLTAGGFSDAGPVADQPLHLTSHDPGAIDGRRMASS